MSIYNEHSRNISLEDFLSMRYSFSIKDFAIVANEFLVEEKCLSKKEESILVEQLQKSFEFTIKKNEIQIRTKDGLNKSYSPYQILKALPQALENLDIENSDIKKHHIKKLSALKVSAYMVSKNKDTISDFISAQETHFVQMQEGQNAIDLANKRIDYYTTIL